MARAVLQARSRQRFQIFSLSKREEKMKKIYATPTAEVTAVEVERGFYVSQQEPSDWEDM